MFSALLAAASAAPGAAKAAAPAVQATAIPISLPSGFQFDTTPHSPLAQNLPWLTHTFAGFAIVLGALLVVLLALQTTKQEGLSGTVGGRVESATRRLGLDAQIASVTRIVAIAFVVFSVIVSLSGI